MSDTYQTELDYLVKYAEVSSAYFTILWDAAETVAGNGSSFSDAQKAVIRLVGDMLDRGIRVGDVNPREGEEVIPWDLSREEILHRIEHEMQMHEDPSGYINICWSSTH